MAIALRGGPVRGYVNSNFMRNLATWILTIIVAATFFYASYLKLTAAPMLVATFASFGYPPWFMYVTGALESVGAILLFVPRVAFVGAGLLVCITIGALYSHLTHGQAQMIGPPAVLLVLSLVLGTLRNWGRPIRLKPSPFTKY